MSSPDQPDNPEPTPSDEEAARLLEVGLGAPSAHGAKTPPSPEEVEGWFPQLEILEVIGQGGMGVVYKARQRTLDRIVALKILPQALSQDPAFAERFTREARTLAKLQHPHIVGVFEFGEADGRYYLLMEYVDGVNLRQLMDTESLTPPEALAIVPQVCDALQYAHDQGVVHRDIKPENVLLDRTGNVKVADFGLAKLTQRGPSDFTLTGTGQVMGTLHYMAPEQYRTPQDVDHRADIFSLGVVFYEMLTGELPVGRFVKPSAGKDLDARLDEIVMKTLEREREMRYQQAGDIRTEVATLATPGAAVPAPPPPPPPVTPRAATPTPAPAPSEPAPERRRWSRWAIATPIVYALGMGMIPVVYELVDELSRPRSAIDFYNTSAWALKNYYGTVAAFWTAIVAAALTAAVALIATILTTVRKHRLKGQTLSVVMLILSLVSIPVALLFGDYEIGRAAEFAFHRARTDPDGRHYRPKFFGESSQREAQQAWNGIRDTWNEYTRLMRTRDLDVAEARPLYGKEDWSELRAMSPESLRIGRAQRDLGMGLVGKDQMPIPPWQLQIREVHFSEWDREAELLAQDRKTVGGLNESWMLSETPDGRTEWKRADSDKQKMVRFRMKRDGDRWVFVKGPVQVGEDPEAEVGSSGK